MESKEPHLPQHGGQAGVAITATAHVGPGTSAHIKPALTDRPELSLSSYSLPLMRFLIPGICFILYPLPSPPEPLPHTTYTHRGRCLWDSFFSWHSLGCGGGRGVCFKQRSEAHWPGATVPWGPTHCPRARSSVLWTQLLTCLWFWKLHRTPLSCWGCS